MIRTFLKHQIYDFCLSVCFDRLEKNLNIPRMKIPEVGEYYMRIHDKFSGDIFIDCTIINPYDLGYWNELDDIEKRTFGFAIRFKTWVDDNGLVQSDVSEEIDVYDEIHFDLKNLSTLVFDNDEDVA